MIPSVSIEPVDFSAREEHFVDHLAPVWLALPPHVRGRFYVADEAVREHAARLGVDRTRVGWPERRAGEGPVVCASWGDLKVCSRLRRPVVLFEHGAGQSYSNRHHSYVGGGGREAVVLFVVPNEQAADRCRRYWPTTRVEVVGAPKLDRLLEVEVPPGPPVACISFHWHSERRAMTAPEVGSALGHYRAALSGLRAGLEDRGVELIGHAHPRARADVGPVYESAGIEVVEHFSEVVERAHVYGVDNSSTLFEFAALDRPVVVLNAPEYRRDVEHGLRFWRDAVVGRNVDHPGDLLDGFLEALEDPLELAQSRREVVARVYPVRGGSARRSAEVIVSRLGRRICGVCGAQSCACGGPTDGKTGPGLQIVAAEPRAKRDERRLYHGRGSGRFLCTPAHAARLGLVPVDPDPAPVEPDEVLLDGPGTEEVKPKPKRSTSGSSSGRRRKKTEPNS